MTAPCVPPAGSSGPRVRAVNVGAVRTVEWRGQAIRTAIWKSPVPGRVRVEGVNLEGDDQADRTVHGGEHKAVYSYALEDYDFWRAREAADLPLGAFGENLTLANYDLRTALVGEHWQVGSAILAVTQPRMPCFKLGIRFGDAHFPKRFLAAARPGAYLRVIRAGDVGAEDEVRVISRPPHQVTISWMLQALDDREKAQALSHVPGLPDFWRGIANRAR